MHDDRKSANLQREDDQLAAKSCALRQENFRGSKTEAMLAFEYDRIPTFLKTPHAVRAQRKVATALWFIVPTMLLVVAVVGGIDAYRDHEHSVEFEKAQAKLDADLQRDRLPH